MPFDWKSVLSKALNLSFGLNVGLERLKPQKPFQRILPNDLIFYETGFSGFRSTFWVYNRRPKQALSLLDTNLKSKPTFSHFSPSPSHLEKPFFPFWPSLLHLKNPKSTNLKPQIRLKSTKRAIKLTNHNALLVVVLERPTRWSLVGGQEPGVAFVKGKGKCARLSMDCLSSISGMTFTFCSAFTFFSLRIHWIIYLSLVPLSQTPSLTPLPLVW